MFRKFLKPLGTSALPSYRSGVMSAVLASLRHAQASRSKKESLCSRKLSMTVCQSGQPIPNSTFYSRFIGSVRMYVGILSKGISRHLGLFVGFITFALTAGFAYPTALLLRVHHADMFCLDFFLVRFLAQL